MTTTKPLPTSFILRSDGVTRVTTGTGADDLTHEAPRDEFLKLLGEVAPFSTGIMPPGVISMQHGGGFTQLVVEMPPGEYLTCWGASEHSGHAVYRLGMPWRYFVGVFKDEGLLGARVFYSPRRVTHERQPLFHGNVPNLNCKGYGAHGTSTGVGWVCLYHTSQKFPTTADKARYLIDRCSGLEPYNDGNMSGTDGPRFYHGMLTAAKIKDREFLYDPKVWEEKTAKEGFEWTLEDDLWIPILVASNDDQTRHHPGGISLTLGMVMHYPSKFYYQDPQQPKIYDAQALGLDMEVASKAKGVHASSYPTISPLKTLWDALQAGFTKAMGAKAAATKIDLSPLEEPPDTFKEVKWEASGYRVTHTPGDGKLDEKGGCTNCGDPFAPSELTQMTDVALLKALKTVPKDNLLCGGCLIDLTADAQAVISGGGQRGTAARSGTAKKAAKPTNKTVKKAIKKVPMKKPAVKTAAAK